MQRNLILTDQGDLLLRWGDHLVGEQEEKEETEKEQSGR